MLSKDLDLGPGASCGLSRFMMAEVGTFARAINQILQDEPALQDRLPIDPSNDDLFDTVSDGLVLAYLLKAIDPSLIDLSRIAHGAKANVFQIRANIDLALESCKKIIKVVGIDAQTFLDKTPDLILGIIWQLLRIHMANQVRKRLENTKLRRQLSRKLTSM